MVSSFDSCCLLFVRLSDVRLDVRPLDLLERLLALQQVAQPMLFAVGQDQGAVNCDDTPSLLPRLGMPVRDLVAVALDSPRGTAPRDANRHWFWGLDRPATDRTIEYPALLEFPPPVLMAYLATDAGPGSLSAPTHPFCGADNPWQTLPRKPYRTTAPSASY